MRGFRKTSKAAYSSGAKTAGVSSALSGIANSIPNTINKGQNNGIKQTTSSGGNPKKRRF